MLQFKKYFANVFARLAAALENNEESSVFKSLIMELFRKTKKNQQIARMKKTLNILLMSTWSSGKRSFYKYYNLERNQSHLKVLHFCQNFSIIIPTHSWNLSLWFIPTGN